MTLMNTSTSVYFANPTSVNGAITASSAVATILKNPAFPTQGTIITGNVGLPISSAQINTAVNPTNASYIAPLGKISPVLAGQYATGYPVLSANLTNAYTFDSGWLKGFKLGGTVLHVRPVPCLLLAIRACIVGIDRRCRSCSVLCSRFDNV